MKVIKRIFLLFFFFVFTVIGTLLLIAFVYEDEVKEYMIKELNKNLKTKVIVDSKNIDFSLISNFPYASLDFKNVTILESQISNSAAGLKGKKKYLKQDTLFVSKKFSLQFNLMDIVSRNYVVKKVKSSGGRVLLRSGSDGSVNWDIWKETDDTSSTLEQSVFNLEKFQLDDISLRFVDFKNKTNISCLINQGVIGGEFSSKEYDLSISGNVMMHQFYIDSVNYINKKPVSLDLNLEVNNETKSYIFSDAAVFISDLKVAVEGKYTDSEPASIDLYLKGKDMDIQSVLSLLPEKYHKHISDYDSDGEFYCNAHISGRWGNSHSPEIKTDFGITKSEITQLSSGIVLKDVHMLGNFYSSSSKDFLELKTFSAALKNGSISGSLRVDNLASPLMQTSLAANIPLSDLQHLLKLDTIWEYPVESLSGAIQIKLEYKGRLNNSGKYLKSDFDNMQLSGEMNLENSGMKIKNSELAFDSINGSFVLENNNINVNSFSGKTSKSDFYLKGFVKNILAYSFTEDADITVDAAFQSGNFDLNDFLTNEQESSKRDTVYEISFSPRINFNLNSNIGRLSFRRFEAENIRGIFQLRNQKLIADPISFSTMGGSVTATGMIDCTQDSFILITCTSNLNKLNINKLFYQFEDFGQDVITHNNLKGIGTAEVQFASVWKSDLSVDMNKIYVRSNLVIEKGELLKFEPMKTLSKYISVSELENIKFSKLQNQIEIRNQTIFIPKMDIQSSALDVTLSGTHTFENEIDYHVKVLMSDVLFQKARKAKKENDEFGVIEDDKSGRTSLFISMTGTVDNPIVKYDKQGAKQNLKENITEEKQTLKQILREEFGWFKKDTSIVKKDKPKDDGKFIIKWDEDEKDDKKKEDDDF